MKFAITGLGLITPLGWGVETNWRRVAGGESAVEYDRKHEAFIARVKGFDIDDAFRQDALADAAISEALADAGLSERQTAKICGGLTSGFPQGNNGRKNCDFGGNSPFFKIGLVLGESKPNLFKLRNRNNGEKQLTNKGHSLGFLSEDLPADNGKKFFLPYLCSVVSAACATGLIALIKACSLIENGDFDAVVCGCSETSLHPLYVSAFKRMGVLSKNGVFPFLHKDRSGFALGEGAGFVVVENYEKARWRGAKIYCVIAGKSYGIYNDNPVKITSSKGMEKIIKKALNGQTPDFVHAHGTGTAANDFFENEALERQGVNNCGRRLAVCDGQITDNSGCGLPSGFLSGNDGQKICKSDINSGLSLVVSTKWQTGHMLSVSGIAGAIFGATAVYKREWPAAPETSFSLGGGRRIKSALALSWGFGGQGAAVFFKACDKADGER
jgi:3-oxoacyl-(acyl-carrier-protein) synthase